MPIGEAIAEFLEDEAEPFEAFEVGGNGVEFFLGIAPCELGSDWLSGAVAGGGAEPIADGGDREIIEVLANRSNRQAVCGSGA